MKTALTNGSHRQATAAPQCGRRSLCRSLCHSLCRDMRQSMYQSLCRAMRYSLRPLWLSLWVLVAGASGTAMAAMPDDCTHLSGDQEVDKTLDASNNFQACFSLSGNDAGKDVTIYTFSGLEYNHAAEAFTFVDGSDEVEPLAEASTETSDVTALEFTQTSAGSYFVITMPDDAGTEFELDLGHIPLSDEVHVFVEIRPEP